MELYYGKNYIRQLLGLDFLVEADVKQVADESTDEKIREVVGNAPEELDTLGEVSDAIKTNQNDISVIKEALLSIQTGEGGSSSGDYWETLDNEEIQDVVDLIFY